MSHTIKRPKGARRTKKRVGRGNGSQKGTYSARGMKGQRARSGGKSKTAYRGYKRSLQQIPKLRGFKSLKAKPETITLTMIDKVANNDMTLTPMKLKKLGVVAHPEFGVKVVATGSITKKVTLKGCVASKSALDQIEKAGGKVLA